jgi:type I restriction enzyme S subunit
LLSQYKKGVMQQLFSGKLRFKDENGNDYADWEEKLLGSLTERNICYGVVQPGIDDENGVKFIRGGDVFNGNVSKNLRVISKEITDNYKRTYLKGGELIMSLVGYPGETAIVPNYLKGANLARQVGLIDLKKSTNSVYVHYYISSTYGKKNLLGKTIGSAQQVINIVDLKKLKIPVPSILEQQKIAAFLSSIDTKIESVNQQITQTQTFKKGLLQQLFV